MDLLALLDIALGSSTDDSSLLDFVVAEFVARERAMRLNFSIAIGEDSIVDFTERTLQPGLCTKISCNFRRASSRGVPSREAIFACARVFHRHRQH